MLSTTRTPSSKAFLRFLIGAFVAVEIIALFSLRYWRAELNYYVTTNDLVLSSDIDIAYQQSLITLGIAVLFPVLGGLGLLHLSNKTLAGVLNLPVSKATENVVELDAPLTEAERDTKHNCLPSEPFDLEDTVEDQSDKYDIVEDHTAEVVTANR